MYIAVTKHKNNFLKTIACNFKLLEEKNNNNKPILNILKFIHENYADVNLSLEELSKNIFLTPAHICVI